MIYIFTVLGFDQSQYTLAERSAFYRLRLRLLSPANTLFLRRPQLHLIGIPGTASGKNIYNLHCEIVVMLHYTYFSQWMTFMLCLQTP